jgi:hypothetical protein
MYLTMPNTHEWAGPPGKDPSMGNFARSWRIPLDDEHHIRFDYRVYPFGDKNDPAFREKVVGRTGMRPIGQTAQISNDILAGKLDFKSIKENPELVPGMGFLTTVQDCVVQSSLGPMATREHKEMLGQTDLAIAHLRRMWKQELTAFANGKPQRDWKRPNSLWSALDNA